MEVGFQSPTSDVLDWSINHSAIKPFLAITYLSMAFVFVDLISKLEQTRSSKNKEIKLEKCPLNSEIQTLIQNKNTKNGPTEIFHIIDKSLYNVYNISFRFRSKDNNRNHFFLYDYEFLFMITATIWLWSRPPLTNCIRFELRSTDKTHEIILAQKNTSFGKN